MQDFQSQTEAFEHSIENELREGALSFPTVFDVSLRIKKLADDPDASLESIAAVVRTEPVLSAKTVRMANSLLLNPYRAEITGVNEAVSRIGLSTLRCLAYAVAAEQLSHDQRSQQMRLVASGLWMHSIDVASWAYAFTRHLRNGNPDTALLTGLMSNIGQFYLLARAAAYPALERDVGGFAQFVAVWDRPVCHAILDAFDLPESIVDACMMEAPANTAAHWPPATLGNVLYLSRLAAETPNPFDSMRGVQHRPEQLEACTSEIERTAFDELIAAARSTRQEMLSAVCG